jgi:hypothetical protein
MDKRKRTTPNFLGAARPAWKLPHSVADSKPFSCANAHALFLRVYFKTNLLLVSGH